MSNILELMEGDHRHCDDEFSLIEQALAASDWAGVSAATEAFCASMERHLGAEEQVLFPAFEQATGMSMGPTRVMRVEHGQMRGLFDELRATATGRDANTLRGCIETLLIMMQQHNVKEEHMLYPMCDDHLGAQRVSVREALAVAVQRRE